MFQLQIRQILPVLLITFPGVANSQNFNEILGRPTDHSVTVSVLFPQAREVKIEYGLTQSDLGQSTPVTTGTADTPVVTDLQPLLPDTRYFYRTVPEPGCAEFSVRSCPDISHTAGNGQFIYICH
jgi:hypothetical protein